MDIGVAEYVTNSIYCNLILVDVDFEKKMLSNKDLPNSSDEPTAMGIELLDSF